MQDFKNYINNLNWLVVFDVIAVILFSVFVFLFCKKRKNPVLALIVGGYSLLYFAVCLVWSLTTYGALSITKFILEVVGIFGMIAIVVVYQSDFKAIFAKMARVGNKSKHHQSYGPTSDDDLRIASGEIVKACQTLSKNDTGALIVIVPNAIPRHLLSTGTEINAKISCALLETIFNKKAPLHDGAVVIKGNTILAAGCFLPLSEAVSISKDLGTRHRAAIGITEQSDVLSIVVSEETGIISLARKGVLKRFMTPEKMFEEIEDVFGLNYFKQVSKKQRNIK